MLLTFWRIWQDPAGGLGEPPKTFMVEKTRHAQRGQFS
jgi:hypothetical protein